MESNDYIQLALIRNVPEEETNNYLICIQKDLGGVAGHFILMTSKNIKKLKTLNKKIGVGYVSSKNRFKKESFRGIDWVFTNNTQKLISQIIS